MAVVVLRWGQNHEKHQCWARGGRNCEITANVIAAAAKQAGVEIELEKITDIAEIMGYGVMSTPGVAVDGKLVHSGGVPGPDKVKEWVAW